MTSELRECPFCGCGIRKVGSLSGNATQADTRRQHLAEVSDHIKATRGDRETVPATQADTGNAAVVRELKGLEFSMQDGELRALITFPMQHRILAALSNEGKA